MPWPYIHPVWMRDAVSGQTVRSAGQTGVHKARWAGQTGLGSAHKTCRGASGLQYAYIYALWVGTLSVCRITELDPQVTPHTLMWGGWSGVATGYLLVIIKYLHLYLLLII